MVSLDEMRLPLLEFIQQKKRQEAVEEIPLGIHSTHYFDIRDPNVPDGGVVFSFFAPRIDISGIFIPALTDISVPKQMD